MEWIYNEQVHRRETIEQVAQWLVEELEALGNLLEERREASYIPSDFPEARLNQKQLDQVINKLQRKNRR